MEILKLQTENNETTIWNTDTTNRKYWHLKKKILKLQIKMLNIQIGHIEITHDNWKSRTILHENN